MLTLGQRIVRLRKKKNWRQQDLAEKLGVTTRQLIRWENDQQQLHQKSIAKLAEALEVPVEELTALPSDNVLERVEDQELRELLNYVPELGPQQALALKIILREMVTCHQMARYAATSQAKMAG